MPPRWLCTPSSHVQTKSAEEQPRIDATNRAACGSLPRWQRAALSLTAACQSTTAARNSLVAIMIAAIATPVTWTAPKGGRSEAPVSALRALKWSLTATQDESQNSKHDILRAMAVRSQWRRQRRTTRIFVLSEPGPFETPTTYFPTPVGLGHSCSRAHTYSCTPLRPRPW